MWCNADYDKLYDDQLVAPTEDARKAILTQMQQMWYDAAPYHILHYDDNLHAYRTDKFAGWQNQPANGTPLFAYGTLGYTLLTDATAVPSPTPAPTGSATAGGAPSPGSTAAPSGSGSGTSSGGLPILPIAIVIVIVAAVAGIFAMRRNRPKTASDDDDE